MCVLCGWSVHNQLRTFRGKRLRSLREGNSASRQMAASSYSIACSLGLQLARLPATSGPAILHNCMRRFLKMSLSLPLLSNIPLVRLLCRP